MSEPDARPLVSVVVAVRDAASTLARCLDSVIGQEGVWAELIVVDGASRDGSQHIIEERSDHIAWWESRPDRGICHAWNKALDRVSGEWVCFLGADDRLSSSTVLARVAPQLRGAAGRHRVAYGRLEVVDGAGNVVRTEGRPWEEVRAAFREHMTLPHPATFQRRSLFEVHGRFDESFRIGGDYELLLRELLHGEALFLAGEVLVEMAAGGLSDRPASATTLLRETYRARHMHGLVSTPPWRSFLLLRAIVYAHLRRAFGYRAAEAAAEVWHALTRTPRSGGSA